MAAIGLALTGIVCGLFGYVAYNNLRLSREIQVRIGFERRLTAVIDELNHRVKNILAVIQSIVTRTLRHGSDIDVARELLIGRIHAMSNVVSLLSESQWQGVQTERAVRGARDPPCRPHRGERAGYRRQRAGRAKSVAAVLRTGVAFRRGAFAGRQAPAHRRALGSDRRGARHAPFISAGKSSTPARRPAARTAISASSCSTASHRKRSAAYRKRYFTDVSYVYELTAPMETVVDMTERDRTEQFAAPLKPARDAVSQAETAWTSPAMPI